MRRIEFRHLLHATTASAIFVLVHVPAAAQTPAATAPVENGTAVTQPSVASPVAQASSSELGGDIVVTAQRRSERLQDVPASISAFTGEQLAASGVTSTRDLQLVTPGLVWQQQSFVPQPTIRGIGDRSGGLPGTEQDVPLYIDGVYQPFIVGSLFELNSVERIEVLKGPQGILYGRNAIGGAVNIVTRRPSVEPKLDLSLGYGSFDEVRANAYASAGAGPVAGSIDAQFSRDDGYVTEVVSGRKVSKVKSYSIRGKVVADLSSRDVLTLVGSYSNRDDNTSLANYAINGNTLARRANPSLYAGSKKKREISHSLVPFLNTDQWAGSLTYVHHFDGVDLTSITGYSSNHLDLNVDLDATVAPIATLPSSLYDKAFTQEAYLQSTGGGPFSWIVGGSYFDDDAGYDPTIIGGAPLRSKSTTSAYAAYAQGSYELTSTLTLTGGARYSNDHKCAQATSTSGTTVRRLIKTCKRWDSFDPSVTIDWQARPNLKIFARYASAFKAGVFNVFVLSPTPVNPERVDSYELGIKSDPAPWLRLNVSGYFSDYKQIQVTVRDPIQVLNLLQNAAAAHIYGIEGEAVLRPTSHWNIRPSASWLHARFTSFERGQDVAPVAGGGNAQFFFDATGYRLIKNPTWTAALASDYTVDLPSGSLVGSANLFYQSSYNLTLSGRLKQPGYAMVNANLTYTTEDGKYSVALWGKNLSNKQPYLSTQISAIGDIATPSRPRTFGGTVSAHF